MWTKLIALGATAVSALCATSACVFAEEEITTEAETGAAQLADQQFCGGIASIRCPDGYTCADDPSDTCDPDQGGADCGGLCVEDPPVTQCTPDPAKEYFLWDPAQCAAALFVCESGSQPFFDDCGCGCQEGVACGSTLCGAGQFCCNKSCSLCAPEGGACTQQFCSP